jgi:phthiocerol/phenolphthiocerol synthesis type-I polyketide synthase D
VSSTRRIAQRAHSDVAVIGMACRVPGAGDVDEFWQLLLDRRVATGSVPPDRIALRAGLTAVGTADGSAFGGFLDRVGDFDAEFFGLTPAEASQLDPQQRLVLEVAWTALEDAGIVPAQLAGSATGVFVGQATHDFSMLLGARTGELGPYTNPGLSAAITANRLSYLWDLHGPSLTVDTACSSSLVAVHLAVCSLLAGECDLALVAGVNVLLSPIAHIGAARLTALAPDGRCRPFDEKASGYVRGEGAVAVVLKRLCDAERDADAPYAVIRRTGINQDGRTNGLTAPSGRAQAALLTRVLDRAGIDAARVDYLEAHGTGTALGDPIEARGIASAYGQRRRRPLLVGSVKANLGHLEAAAGLIGLVKVAIMLRHRTIPPQANFTTANARIDERRLRLSVSTVALPWPRRSRPVAAAVSSFGFGGTNAHAVLVEAPPARHAPEPTAEPPLTTGAVLLPLSARAPQALATIAAQYAGMVRSAPSWAAVGELAAAATALRTHHDHRVAPVGASAEELADLLDRIASGAIVASRGVVAVRPRLAFVYPGQGGQWAGMARSLLSSDAVFAAEAAACDEAFTPWLGWSVVGALLGSADVDLCLSRVAQPLIATVQLALTASLRAHGVHPDGVVGHSMGEVCAAVTAGALSRDMGCRIIAERAAAAHEARGGAMATVDSGADEVRTILGELALGVSIAAINSPRATVIAGPPDDLTLAMRQFRDRGNRVRRLPVDFASHHPLMNGAADILQARLGLVSDRGPTVPLYRTTTGRLLTDTPLDAGYWAANLRSPVLFADSVLAMLADGYTHFVEVGPHPTLVAAIEECIVASGRPASAGATLHRDGSHRHGVIDLVAALYTMGWTPPPRQAPRRWAQYLPRYPYQRRAVATRGLNGARRSQPRVTARPGPRASAATPLRSPAPTADLSSQLVRCPGAEERVELLRAALFREIAEFAPAARLSASMPLHDLGLDSLMAIELRNRLEQRLHMTLPVTMIWRYPTVEALARALATRADAPWTAPVTVRSASPAMNPVTELLTLIDDVQLELHRSAG